MGVVTKGECIKCHKTSPIDEDGYCDSCDKDAVSGPSILVTALLVLAVLVGVLAVAFTVPVVTYYLKVWEAWWSYPG